MALLARHVDNTSHKRYSYVVLASKIHCILVARQSTSLNYKGEYRYTLFVVILVVTHLQDDS